MTINLVKGQKVDITKDRPTMKSIQVGMGWDVAEGRSMDLDASAILLNEYGKISQNGNTVYFGRKQSSCGGVVHSGDNLTGAGSGDDETIRMFFDKIDPKVQKVLFVVNIYSAKSKGQDFSMVKNAYIRVLDGSEELVRFNLSEDYNGMTSMLVGEVYRHGGGWKFNALGTGSLNGSVNEIVESYT